MQGGRGVGGLSPHFSNKLNQVVLNFIRHFIINFYSFS